MHTTLKRLIKKYLGEKYEPSPELKNLFDAVSSNYEQFEQDRALIERSLEISSSELSEINRKLREYLEIAGVILISLDPEGKVKIINKKGIDILGYEKKEIIGENWFERFVPIEEKKGSEEFFEKMINETGEAAESYENSILTKDKNKRTIYWHNSLVRDKKGKVIEILSSGEDITERKTYEEEMKKKNNEMEMFTKLAIDRELKMVELKEKIKELEERFQSLKN